MTGGAFGTGAVPAPLEWALAKDPTPEARIRGVFAQFVPGERRRAI